MKTELKAGIFISLAYFIWLLSEFKLGLHSSKIDYYEFIFWMALIIPVTGIYLTLRYLRNKEFKGKINFMQGFLSGIKITGVISILIPVLSWLYVSAINPTFFPAMKDHQEKMIEDLNISSVIEKESLKNEIAIKNSIASYLLRQFSFVLISGTLITIICAIFIRKTDSQEEHPVNDNKTSDFSSN